MLDIRVQRMYRFETDRPLKAFIDITINNVLLIKGMRVMDGKNGLFVSMPREQAKDAKWYDTVSCLTMEMRDQITEVVLEAYNEEDHPADRKVHEPDNSLGEKLVRKYNKRR